MSDDINDKLNEISKKLDNLMKDNSLAHKGLTYMLQEVQRSQGERFDKVDQQLQRISQTFCGSTLEFFNDTVEDIEHIEQKSNLKLPKDLRKSIAKVHASIRRK